MKDDPLIQAFVAANPGTLKGRVFSDADLPKGHKLNDKAKAAYFAAQTERYRIIEIDETRSPPMPIIAEERDERVMRTLSPEARGVATILLRLEPEQRAEVLKAFAPSGELISPFTKV